MVFDRFSEFNQKAKEAALDDNLTRPSPQAKSKRGANVAFAKAGSLETGQISATVQDEQTVFSDQSEIMQMPAFFKQVGELKTESGKIDVLTREIEQLHRRALNSTSAEESSECSEKIEAVIARTNQIANKCRQILKDMDTTTKTLSQQLTDAGHSPASSADLRMREQSHRRLSKNFVDTMKRYQKMQETFQTKYRDQIERQYRIVNPKATSQDVSALLADEGNARQQIFAAAVRDDARKSLEQMKSRFTDVKNVEKSIMDLHQLFLQMQDMIVEQGDIINKIGYNVEKTEAYTGDAAQSMKAALESQKSIQKKKWILAIILVLIVGFFVGLVIFLLVPVLRR